MRFHLSTRTDSPKFALKHMAHKFEFVFGNPTVLDLQNRVFGFAWIRLCRFVWIRYGFAARIHGYAELWKNPFQDDKFSSEITNFCYIKKRQNRRFTFDIYSDFCLKQASNVFCSIFVFAYVPLYMLFKIRTLHFQSVMFLTWRKLTVQSVSMETCYNGLPN